MNSCLKNFNLSKFTGHWALFASVALTLGFSLSGCKHPPGESLREKLAQNQKSDPSPSPSPVAGKKRDYGDRDPLEVLGEEIKETKFGRARLSEQTVDDVVTEDSKNTGNGSPKSLVKEKAPSIHCPEGSRAVGAEPPRGDAIWCETVASFGAGEKNGIFLKFNRDGAKKFEAHYSHDKLDGLAVTYFPNGEKAEVKHFREGIQNGEWIRWNADGQKISQGFFSDGKKNGKFSFWDRSGQPVEQGKFENNIKTGVWSSFSRDGELKSRVTWAGGKKEGKAENFYRGGQLASSGTYTNNKLSGVWIYFAADGHKTGQGTFQEGRKVGVWVSYSPNGEIAKTKDFNSPARKKGEQSHNQETEEGLTDDAWREL